MPAPRPVLSLSKEQERNKYKGTITARLSKGDRSIDFVVEANDAKDAQRLIRKIVALGRLSVSAA